MPRKNRYRSVYTLVSDDEYREFRKYLRLDRKTATDWIDEQIRSYIEEARTHWKALQVKGGKYAEQ